MKTPVVLATFLLGIAAAQQAGACEWMHQAAKPAATAACDNDTCATGEATQQAAATPRPAEQAAPASSVVASAQR